MAAIQVETLLFDDLRFLSKVLSGQALNFLFQSLLVESNKVYFFSETVELVFILVNDLIQFFLPLFDQAFCLFLVRAL